MLANKGRINTEAMPPALLYRGWNMLACEAGYAAWKLRLMQESARAAGDYKTADQMRKIADDLEASLSFVGANYTLEKAA